MKINTGINLILWIFIILILFSVFSQVVLGEPWGFASVYGTSMEPTMHFDDIVFVLPYLSPIMGSPEKGDIIVFERGGEMVMHRVVEITENGYITKGDNLDETDQEMGVHPITEDQIHGFAPVIDGHPILIPKLGMVTRIVSKNGMRPYVVAGLLMLFFICFFFETKS
ncbi:MAG: signal peptidase I [Candidatus Syntropharchaeia archaeon]